MLVDCSSAHGYGGEALQLPEIHMGGDQVFSLNEENLILRACDAAAHLPC
jgi:hypothetical protein